MTAVQRRRLGRELEVSALGLGCMGMSAFYGAADEREAVRTIHRARELGIDFLDTADVYREHSVNEELVGRAIAGRRSTFIVATKFGHTYDPAHRGRDLDGRPEYVRWACEQSLRRLRADHIDLYYLHRPDPMTPIEVTVGAMAELVGEGKVRYLGLSEVRAETLRRAVVVHPIAAVQSEYSLFERSLEADVLPACRELGVGVVAYSPLGRGVLARGFDVERLDEDDWRREVPRLQAEHMTRNMKLLEQLAAIAQELAITPAQLALSWLLAQPDVVALPGMRRVAHVEENVDAAGVELPSKAIRLLDEQCAHGVVSGNRYPDYAVAWLDHGTPEPGTA